MWPLSEQKKWFHWCWFLITVIPFIVFLVLLALPRMLFCQLWEFVRLLRGK